jgi:hypothetical protein
MATPGRNPYDRDLNMTMFISKERGFVSTDFGASFGGAPPESRILAFALPPAEAPAPPPRLSDTMVVGQAIRAQRALHVRARRVLRRTQRLAHLAWTWMRRNLIETAVVLKATVHEIRRQASREMEQRQPRSELPTLIDADHD